MGQLKNADLVDKKFVVFAEDCFGLFTSKIAASLLRYRADRCVAVLDSTKAGQTVQDVLGYGGPIPIVAAVDDALQAQPEVLVIGKGLHSADLPAGWKKHLLAAMRHKLHIINSIHYRLDSDPELARAIRESGITVWETKDPPTVPLNKARVLDLDTWIVHTCGSDSNIGKKTAALQIYVEANRRGIPTGFAATGQSGMLISGHGVAVDGVPGDFMGGAVEQVVLEAAEGNDWVIVEGQGVAQPHRRERRRAGHPARSAAARAGLLPPPRSGADEGVGHADHPDPGADPDERGADRLRAAGEGRRRQREQCRVRRPGVPPGGGEARVTDRAAGHRSRPGRWRRAAGGGPAGPPAAHLRAPGPSLTDPLSRRRTDGRRRDGPHACALP